MSLPYPEGDDPAARAPRQEAKAREDQRRQRRELIQRVKDHVIGDWRKTGYSIPPGVKAQALEAIEVKLSALPVDELPAAEVLAIAAGVRDSLYQPVLQAQDEARVREEEQRRQAIAPPQQPAPPPVMPAVAPASALIARPTAPPAPTAEAGGGQAQKDALVQRGLDRVEQDLDLRDLDLETKAEIWDRVADQLEERLTGSEDAADADELADELLAEEFGDDEPDGR